MLFKNSEREYGSVARSFHWAVAVIVIGMLALGVYMTRIDFSPFKLELYGIHKSFGTLVFMLALVRVLWRFANPKPAPLENHADWERKLASLTHILLYVFLFVMPLSGWLMTSAGAFPHHFFGFFDVPAATGESEFLFKLTRTVHEYSACGLAAIIALHFAGAMKHYLMDRDNTLRRMMPARPLLFFGGLLLLYAGLVVMNNYSAPVESVEDHNARDYGSALEPRHKNTGSVRVDESSANVAVSAPSWTILKDESALDFTASVEGKPFNGTFERFGGNIAFAPDNLAASRVDITIDMASVKSSSSERDAYMAAPDWFDVESFPESEFVATEFENIEGNQYVAHGGLTIKGNMIPVSLPFSLVMTKNAKGNNIANMDGTLTLKRLQYDLGVGQWKNTDTVANEVTVTVSVKARQKN